MKFINSFSEIADEFEMFIVDLWGVLHDGTSPYPGAIETLTKLRQQDKKIILLSNAPRQSHKVEAVLNDMGFSKDLYDHVLTSGQVTHDYLRDRVSGVRSQEVLTPTLSQGERGMKPDTKSPIPYYYIGPQKDEDILADLPDYEMVDDPKGADFVLAAGFDKPGDEFETKQAQIDECLAADLLLICANPDRKVVKQDGTVWLCSGMIYDYYVEKGGKAIIFGKPYKDVYERCFEMFAVIGCPSSEATTANGKRQTDNICAIGDSLHTDIAGANGVGIASVLCAGGILAKELGIETGQMPTIEKIETLCQRDKARPDMVTPSFIW